jgi:hypothetical protein
VPPAHTSHRPMMATVSGALGTCARALKTHEPCCTGRPTWSFFMLEACGPQGTIGRIAPLEPSRQRRRVQSCRTSGGVRALPSKEAGSGAMVHGWHWSPPKLGGWVRSHRKHGSAGAHLGKEAGSGAVGHVVAHGSTPRSLS